MTTKQLSEFLEGRLVSAALSKEISAEVEAYRNGACVRGSSMPVVLEGRSPITVGRVQIELLCEAFLSRSLSLWEVSYICEALQMGESVIFESERIRDALDKLVDLDDGETTATDAVVSARKLVQENPGVCPGT